MAILDITSGLWLLHTMVPFADVKGLVASLLLLDKTTSVMVRVSTRSPWTIDCGMDIAVSVNPSNVVTEPTGSVSTCQGLLLTTLSSGSVQMRRGPMKISSLKILTYMCSEETAMDLYVELLEF